MKESYGMVVLDIIVYSIRILIGIPLFLVFGIMHFMVLGAEKIVSLLISLVRGGQVGIKKLSRTTQLLFDIGGTLVFGLDRWLGEEE